MRKRDDAVWAERREVLRRCAESGLSAAEFCRREGIAYWTFCSWKNRLARDAEAFSAPPAASPVFAELVVEPESESSVSSPRPLVEIALPGGAVVRVFSGANASVIRPIVEALESC